MAERGARTGETGSGQTPMVTLFAKVRTGLAFGSQCKPQHQQMPLQLSGAEGSGWLATGCCDKEEVKKYGLSHRSQWGE